MSKFHFQSKVCFFHSRIVKLSKASIIGQSTFGMEGTEGGEFEELQIRDASKAVGEVLRKIKDKTEVDLLNVNCEVTRRQKIPIYFWIFISI